MYRLTPKITMMAGTGFNIEKEKLVGIEVLEEVNNHFISYFYKITKRKINLTEIFNDNKFSIRDFKLEQDIREYNKQIENDYSEKNILNYIYRKIFKKFQDEISHYCRNVYHILKFIRESEENQQNLNKKSSFRKYADIFQSQLNVNEQFLLFYNFINFNENDNEEYLNPINIVNHYNFLENLGRNNLLDKELHNNKKFYTFDIK